MAGPTTTGYRLRKFVRRYRLQVASAAAVAVALVAGLTLSTALWLEARDARRQAQERAETAERVTELLLDLFQDASPERSMGEDLPVRLVLRRGEQVLAEALLDQPAVRSRLLASLGRVRESLGSFEHARRNLSEALRLAPEGSGAVSIEDRLSWELGLAATTAALGRYEEAKERLNRALRASVNELGPDHRISVLTGIELGVVLHRRGRSREAADLLRHWIGRMESVPGLHAAERARCLLQYATVAHELGRNEESLRSFERGAEILDQAFPEGHPRTVRMLADATRPLVALGRGREAAVRVERAKSLAMRIFGPDHPDYAAVLVQQAFVLRKEHRLGEARLVLRDAASAMERLFGEGHPNVAFARNDLGATELQLGLLGDAKVALEAAREVWQAHFPGDHLHVSVCLGNLGEVLSLLGEPKQSRQLADQALAMRRRLAEREGCPLAPALAQHGATCAFLGDSAAAEASLVEVLDRAEQLVPGRLLTARVHSQLAFVCNSFRRAEEAVRHAGQALELLDELDPVHIEVRGLALYHRGAAQIALDSHELGVASLEESIAAFDLLQGEAPDIVWPLTHLGGVLVRERPDAAIELLERAYPIWLRRGSADRRWLAGTAMQLAAAMAQRDRLADAVDTLRTADQWLALNCPGESQLRELIGSSLGDFSTRLEDQRDGAPADTPERRGQDR